MKKIFIKFFSILAIFLALWTLFHFYKNQWFLFYEKYKNEQNLNNSNFLDYKISKILSIWHHLSYANSKWIGFIQYIWNNPSINTKNIEYSQKLLENISKISPFFSKTYEWTLFVLPIPNNSNPEYNEEQKKYLQKSLNITNYWMQNLCNYEKIDIILSEKLGNNLWENEKLKNPCKNGMISYLIGFYGGQLWWNPEIAKKYYTIASMQDDVPSVSRVLATISSSGKNNYKNLALNFSLIALWWTDEEPFSCLELANKNIEILQWKINKNNIEFLMENEKNLAKPKGEIWKQSCYDMLERWIKYTYLEYINEEWKKYTEAKSIEELLEKIWLTSIPTVQTQENMTICKKWENWDYCSK